MDEIETDLARVTAGWTSPTFIRQYSVAGDKDEQRRRRIEGYLLVRHGYYISYETPDREGRINTRYALGGSGGRRASGTRARPDSGVAYRIGQVIALSILVAVTIVAVNFITSSNPSRRTGSGTESGDGAPAATDMPDLEHQLEVISGMPGSAAEFEEILDRLQSGGGECAHESSRQAAADALVFSWEHSGKRETLLEFGRAAASLCT